MVHPTLLHLEGAKQGPHRADSVLLVGLNVCEALGELQDGGATVRAAYAANPAVLLQRNVMADPAWQINALIADMKKHEQGPQCMAM